MNTDTFFSQGNSHRVCQDYAIHGLNHVIVSDGCSSMPDTDFGARLLAKAANRVIASDCGGDCCIQDAFNENKLGEVYNRILQNMAKWAVDISLHPDSLFDTLLFAKVLEDRVLVSVLGDGVVAVKWKGGDLDGCISVMKTIFPMSAPPYLRYFLYAEESLSYFHSRGQYEENYYIIYPDGTFSDVEIHPRDFDPPSMKSYPTYAFGKAAVECVAIFSDGVSSFQKIINDGPSKTTKTIPDAFIIKEIMAFRGYQGEFVQRRCQRAFDTFNKNGWRNFDDFSIGVIHL